MRTRWCNVAPKVLLLTASPGWQGAAKRKEAVASACARSRDLKPGEILLTLSLWWQGAADRKEAAATRVLAAAHEERAAAAESMRRLHDTFITVSGGSGGSARGAGGAESLMLRSPDPNVGAGNEGASRGSRPHGAPARGSGNSGAGSDALAASGVRSNGGGGAAGRRLSAADGPGVPLAATQVPDMSGGVRPPSQGGASEPAPDSSPVVHPTLVKQPLASPSGLGSRRAGPSAGGPANAAQGALQPERPAPSSAPDDVPGRAGEDRMAMRQGGVEVLENGNGVKDSAEPERPTADADAAADRAEELGGAAGAAATGRGGQGGGFEADALVRAPDLSVAATPARRLSFGVNSAPRSRSAADSGGDQHSGQDPSPDPYALDNRGSGAQRSGDENAALDPNSMAESGGAPGARSGSAGKAEPVRMEVDDPEGCAGGDAPEGLRKALPRGFMQGAQPGTLDDEGGELAGMA